MKVTGVNQFPTLQPNIGAVGATVPGSGFGDLLSTAVDQVNDKQLAASAALRDFATGKAENVHDVMLTAAEAEISFKMLTQTRNKLVEAYKEIMRMDV